MIFKEWLIHQEIEIFLENAWTAASFQINRQIAEKLGVKYSWFELFMTYAKLFVQGMDILAVATDIADDILLSLNNQTGKFWEDIQKILGTQDQEQLIKYMTTAAYLRARKYATKFHRKKDHLTHTMSSLKTASRDSAIRGNSRRSLSAIGNNFDIEYKKYSGNEEDKIQELRQAILDELKIMAIEANDPRLKKRLILAYKVTDRRLDNPPAFPTMDELIEEFPQIKRGTMFNILKDMQEALKRIAPRYGLENHLMLRKAI